MLTVQGLETFYGVSQVLFGMSLSVERGEVATLIGRNGMGKTTTVKSIFGLVAPRAGDIIFEGRSLMGARPHEVARAGIGLVPEGRRIFPNLTVRENLVATAVPGVNGGWTLEKVLSLFPALTERLGSWGGQLSGGEQQMLAIGRALMTNPKILILDEATEGLAPLVREEIWRCLETLKSLGQSILVIDKNLEHLMRIADRHHIVHKGRMVWTGTSEELRADPSLRQRFLSV
jgi:branched-chain amino acid transport system ATP-binding protein